MSDWSDWRPFPDPRAEGYLVAPLGPGVYELRNSTTGEMVLFGKGKHCAHRMSSILPDGAGTRNNEKKRAYVLEHLQVIEYRTQAFASEVEAILFESTMKLQGRYLFGT